MTTEIAPVRGGKSPLVISTDLWIGRQDELIEKYGGRENYTRLMGETLLARNLQIGKNLDRKPLKKKEINRYLGDLTRYYLEQLQGGEKWTAISYKEGFNLAYNSPHSEVRASALGYMSGSLHLAQWKTEDGEGVWRSGVDHKTELVMGVFNRVLNMARNDTEEVRVEAVNFLGSLVQLGVNQHPTLRGNGKVGLDNAKVFSKTASQAFKEMISKEKSPKVMKALISNCFNLSIDENSGGAKVLKRDWVFTEESLNDFLDEPKYSIEALELIAEILGSKYVGYRHIQFIEPFTVRKMCEVCEDSEILGTKFSVEVRKKASELFKDISNNEYVSSELTDELTTLLFL